MKTKAIKKTAFRPVRSALSRIDFVKVLDFIGRQEPGRTWLEQTGPPEFAYPDQEEIIQRAVDLALEDLSAKGEKASRREVEDYARSISCRYDHDVHKILKSSIFTICGHLFRQDDLDRVFVSPDRRELRHLPELRKAREENLGVVYLINHSSHLDEFIVDVVLEQHGFNLPLFAAGANLMVTPSIERTLMTGSYMIVRRGATRMYLSTLFNYCRALSELGKQQGIFLEAWAGGARTRDGSLRYPRRLVSLQGALASNNDVLVQPIVISYSAVPEDLGLAERAGVINWLNGLRYFRNWARTPHRPDRALGRALAGLYGRAYINFCRPKRLSELEEMRAADPSDVTTDEFAALYSMKEIAQDKKVMASQLTARGLIRTRREEGITLYEATRLELEDLTEYHQRTFGQDPDLEDFIRDRGLPEVVDDGLEMLDRRKVIRRPVLGIGPPTVRSEVGLQYYATHGDRRLYSPSAKENIVVIGGGAWGYSLACLIGLRTIEDKKFHNSSLMLFDPRQVLISSLIDTRTHPLHFPKVRLPKNVFPVSDPTAAFRKATDVLLTSPVEFIESDVRHVLAAAQQPLNLIIVTRGFEPARHQLPVQIASQVAAETGRTDVSIYVLSGPITPAKLAEGRGTALVLAGPRQGANKIGDLFRWTDYSVFICDDPVGVQVAGVMAEAYTLYGSYLVRTKQLQGKGQIAAFFRDSSAEAMLLSRALGGKDDTFRAENPAWSALYMALGMGGPSADFGRQAARSIDKAKAMARDSLNSPTRETLEQGHFLLGYNGIRSAYQNAKRLNLETPILRQAYRTFWKD